MPPGEVTPAAGWAERLDEFAAGFFAAHRVPGGSLAVVTGGGAPFVRAYGWRDREARVPVAADTVFGLASLTKSFTALTLLGQVSGQNVRVDMTGGTLFIDVVRREDGGVSDLFLTGPTNVVCKGCITDENL